MAGRAAAGNPPANQDNLEATIHRAFELGINHFETARGYGSSEMQLGRVLPTLPRDKIIVQTKVAPRATAEEFLQTFDTSMKYLRLDHADLLSLHGVNTASCLIGRSRRMAVSRRRAGFNRRAARGTSAFRPTPRRTSSSTRSPPGILITSTSTGISSTT